MDSCSDLPMYVQQQYDKLALTHPVYKIREWTHEFMQDVDREFFDQKQDGHRYYHSNDIYRASFHLAVESTLDLI